MTLFLLTAADLNEELLVKQQRRSQWQRETQEASAIGAKLKHRLEKQSSCDPRANQHLRTHKDAKQGRLGRHGGKPIRRKTGKKKSTVITAC